MKKFWKALALVGCALLLVVASVAGTYAILTSKTATVSNTFTAGNVSISLKETKVDEYGKPVSPAATIVAAENTPGNNYKLIPNHTYTKDPTIVVASGSEQCYLFVKVVNGIEDIEAASTADHKKIVDQLTANGWKELSSVTNVWYYDAVADDSGDTPVDARTADVTVVVFEEFTIANTDVAGGAGKTIDITAYAAQADGFDNAEDAWDNANFS